jgi:hypothetical protein
MGQFAASEINAVNSYHRYPINYLILLGRELSC